MDRRDLEGERAIVTGASSGLGVEFATLLAKRGADLILVARAEPPMQKLAAQLVDQHRVRVQIEALDLAQPESVGELMKRLQEKALSPSILINNAGVGLHGEFVLQSREDISRMLRLNVLALTELTHRVAESMVLDRKGKILLLSSVAAFQALPIYAAYAASKAYVLSFGEALHEELAAHNVQVSVLCPGPASTAFFRTAGHAETKAMEHLMMPPGPVAEEGLRALFGFPRVAIAIPGPFNKIAAASTHFIPRALQRKIAHRFMR